MAKINKFDTRETLPLSILYFQDVMQTEWDRNPEIEKIYKIVDVEMESHERDCEYKNAVIKRLSEDGSLPLNAPGLANPNPITGKEVFPQTITKVIYK
jgi:hypothetical protein